MRIVECHPPRLWWGLLTGSAALAAAAAAYTLVVRPWHLRWGATAEEVSRSLPGDDLIPAPASISTRAITIRAPIEAVWPWVVQMGQGRGGFYSYEWLENLVGSDIHNADRIVPQWQALRVGAAFRLASAARHPDAALVVAAVEPPHLLLLHSPNVGGPAPAPRREFGYTWAFVLQPAGDAATRLITRGRYQGPRAAVLALESIQFVMERAMLRGLKCRAERGRTAPPAEAAAAASVARAMTA